MSTEPRWRLGYRPALDGLRGIAILLVLLCHSAIPYLGTLGPAGVTVFFTLSGYLITAILLQETSLGAFYWRRALRLLPALLVVVTFAVAAGVATRDDGLAALSYGYNWYRIAGYGQQGLEHAWSLSIEEQFYLVWPMIVLALRCKPRWLLSLTLSAIILVILWRGSLWLQGASTTRLYNGTDTRLDGLLVGAALAIQLSLEPAKAKASRFVILALIAVIGIGLLRYAIVVHVVGPALISTLTATVIATPPTTVATGCPTALWPYSVNAPTASISGTILLCGDWKNRWDSSGMSPHPRCWCSPPALPGCRGGT